MAKNGESKLVLGFLIIIAVILLVATLTFTFTFTGNSIKSIFGKEKPSTVPSATRIIERSSSEEIDVKIVLKLNNRDCGGAYVETLPRLWEVKEILGPGSGLFNEQKGTITWAPIDGPLCGGQDNYYLSYTLIPKPTPSDALVLSGKLAIDGFEVPVENSEINLN